MTFVEEMASLVVRIQNLRARIECSEDPDMALSEQDELKALLARLDSMKGGRGYRIRKARVCVTTNQQ